VFLSWFNIDYRVNDGVWMFLCCVPASIENLYLEGKQKPCRPDVRVACLQAREPHGRV